MICFKTWYPIKESDGMFFVFTLKNICGEIYQDGLGVPFSSLEEAKEYIASKQTK